MNKLAVVLLAGVCSAVLALEPAQTQTQEFDQLKIQLQQKLGAAIDQVAPEVEKARQSAMALEKKLQGQNATNQKKIMDQERAQTQAQLQNAINELKSVSAKLGGEVEQAKQQMQSRLEEKVQELKMMQDRLQAKDGTSPKN